MNIWPGTASQSKAHKVFQNSSKTYYYSSRFFRTDIQEAVTRLYAFVRVADNFVDKTPQDEAGFAQFCDEYAKRSEPREIVRSFHRLEDEYDFEDAWTEAFLASMRQDLEKQEYKTLAETREYMYGSAEVIGLMLAAIFEVQSSAHNAARSLGRGMQYINFLRDIPEDLSFGRNYIPEEIRNRYDMELLSEEYAKEHPNQFKQMMRNELDRGLEWLDMGRSGFSALPRKVRVPTATASDMYAWTAKRIHQDPFVIYTQTVKPSVYRILFTGLKKSIYDRNLRAIQKTNTTA